MITNIFRKTLIRSRTFTRSSSFTRSFSTSKNKFINIIEVSPRDGLQNELKHLSIPKKVFLIKQILDAGFSHVETGSLVNYKLLPSMEGSIETLLHFTPNSNTNRTLGVLLPNMKEWNKYFFPYSSNTSNTNEVKNYNRLLHSNILNEIVFFVSCSDTFNTKNINTTKEQAFQRFYTMKDTIQSNFMNQMYFRGSISCCWGCPYEKSDVYKTIDSVLYCIDQYKKIGVNMIDICDTIGIATPDSTYHLLRTIFKYHDPSLFSLHLHDTNGKAVSCAMVGVNMGITTLQGSLAGIGGCPFSSKRVGNVDTLELLNYLYLSGYHTSINISKAEQIKDWLLKELR